MQPNYARHRQRVLQLSKPHPQNKKPQSHHHNAPNAQPNGTTRSQLAGAAVSGDGAGGGRLTALSAATDLAGPGLPAANGAAGGSGRKPASGVSPCKATTSDATDTLPRPSLHRPRHIDVRKRETAMSKGARPADSRRTARPRSGTRPAAQPGLGRSRLTWWRRFLAAHRPGPGASRESRECASRARLRSPPTRAPSAAPALRHYRTTTDTERRRQRRGAGRERPPSLARTGAPRPPQDGGVPSRRAAPYLGAMSFAARLGPAVPLPAGTGSGERLRSCLGWSPGRAGGRTKGGAGSALPLSWCPQSPRSAAPGPGRDGARLRAGRGGPVAGLLCSQRREGLFSNASLTACILSVPVRAERQGSVPRV